MWCTGTWFSSVLEVLGGWLGLMILKVFFNRNDSMTIFEDSFFFFFLKNKLKVIVNFPNQRIPKAKDKERQTPDIFVEVLKTT